MSPTYWTSTQIMREARAHGWEIRPQEFEGAGWTIHREERLVLSSLNKTITRRRSVAIGERRDGGLCWVRFTYPVSGGMNIDYMGPRTRGKLAAVLRFLNGLNHLSVS